jgi:hypothetical protein
MRWSAVTVRIIILTALGVAILAALVRLSELTWLRG